MADAPSGGSSWGMFEIILVVLLAIGFASQLQNGFKPVAEKESQVPKKETVNAPLNEPTCGLTISRPHSLEKVTSFVTVIGRVEGCQWYPVGNTALYAQVIDSSGRPLSAYTAIPGNVYSPETVVFDTTVPFTTQPVSTKGFLILVPAKVIESQTPNYRIPLTFVRN